MQTVMGNIWVKLVVTLAKFNYAKFLINGANKLKGQVKISGSKNASLPILAATLIV